MRILLGIFAIGVFLNVFSPLLETKSALAELDSGDRIRVMVTGSLGCAYGCNWLYLGSIE